MYKKIFAIHEVREAVSLVDGLDSAGSFLFSPWKKKSKKFHISIAYPKKMK